jgi:hypothetical protein
MILCHVFPRGNGPLGPSADVIDIRRIRKIHCRDQIEKWAKVIRAANIKPE